MCYIEYKMYAAHNDDITILAKLRTNNYYNYSKILHVNKTGFLRLHYIIIAIATF